VTAKLTFMQFCDGTWMCTGGCFNYAFGATADEALQNWRKERGCCGGLRLA
jgi:hypothetical protein